MRDYRYVMENGDIVPVAEMPIDDIRDILAQGGVHVDASDGYDDAAERILERLRLELFIRSLGLR